MILINMYVAWKLKISASTTETNAIAFDDLFDGYVQILNFSYLFIISVQNRIIFWSYEYTVCNPM